MDRLLLLIPTTSYRVSDFLEAADRLDVEVTVGSDQRQVLEKYSQGRTVTLDFRNLDRGTKQVVDFARRFTLRAIVATDEETTVLRYKGRRIHLVPIGKNQLGKQWVIHQCPPPVAYFEDQDEPQRDGDGELV